MTHHLRYLGDDPNLYEAALLKLFQKHPPSRKEFSVTIHEAGKLGGTYTSTRLWPASAKSVHERARLAAHEIVGRCKRLVGSVFKDIMLDF
jgi:hypothetical protein